MINKEGNNKIVGKKKNDTSMVIGFENNGQDFSGCHKAQQRLKDNGYSYGSMQGNERRGIKKGCYTIAKWRNLSKIDIRMLDGYMRGDQRSGKVYIKIFNRYDE